MIKLLIALIERIDFKCYEKKYINIIIKGGKMNKRKILTLFFVLTIAMGFTMTIVSSVDASSGYKNYKGSFKLSHDYYMKDGNGKIVKQWMSGQKNGYGGSNEIWVSQKGKKLNKYGVLRVYKRSSINTAFKVTVKFKYWNGYKYINKYKTKSYVKNKGLANTYIKFKKWIPYSVKIYTKKSNNYEREDAPVEEPLPISDFH